jgi:hypothetical protein
MRAAILKGWAVRPYGSIATTKALSSPALVKRGIMAKAKSWWRLKQVRHRDAVVLSMISAALLLAGEFSGQVQSLYDQYLLPVQGEPLTYSVYLVLFFLAFTTYFGGLLVLLGGMHFLWGKTSRGRFFMSLGIGLSMLGLVRAFAASTLQYGTPAAFFSLQTPFTAFGLLIGVASYTLMGEYALMLKKHARRVYRRWRRARRPTDAAEPQADEVPENGPRRRNGRKIRAS